ncbi:hypothetical protein F5B19DRAFT_141472 [Rostrohypoxylon terebratum]|nr:hypothetical protein F5B19DRAFT_141472 [Rostrohypoxylon terebratum]
MMKTGTHFIGLASYLCMVLLSRKLPWLCPFFPFPFPSSHVMSLARFRQAVHINRHTHIHISPPPPSYILYTQGPLPHQFTRTR